MTRNRKYALAIPLLVLFVLILTVLSQIGGLLVLVGGIGGMYLLRKRFRRIKAFAVGAAAMYVFGLFSVPLLAKPFGRETLPWFATKKVPLRPRCALYPLLFRNYATPELSRILKESSKQFVDSRGLNEKVDYLDACFPFSFPVKGGTPMLPHLSHKDGKKVDLCFVYKNERNGQPTRSKSAIGYWIYEQPRPGDKSYPGNFLRWNMTWIQGINSHRVLDEAGTRDLIKIIAKHSKVQKMFLEPHLQIRLGLGRGYKVRFQSVRAARHDDHVHIQIY